MGRDLDRSGLFRREVEVKNSLGFHLRAACRFVDLARQFQAEIRVFCAGRSAHGHSILDLMMLAADCGALLALEVTGPDAEAAAAALCALVEDGFGESEDRFDGRTGA